MRLVIFDLDGVVYRGPALVPGAAQLVRRLRDDGLAVRFATNNSMHPPREFAKRLTRLGIPADSDEIVTSASATVLHLIRHLPAVRRVLVVGEPGLLEMLRGGGLDAVAAADGAPSDFAGGPLPDRYDAVVSGLDLSFDSRRLAIAQAALLDGARLIATNADARYPVSGGFLPGAGSIVAALSVAGGATPLVIGKPEPAMFEACLESAGTTADEALVVGDNPDADIVAAHRAGIRSALLLTGVATREVAETLEGERRPDVVLDDPQALAEWIEGCLS